MEKNELLSMKPGRDLDIKVALEVMDYVWLKHLLQFSAELAVKWLGTQAELKESCGMYTIVTDSQFAALKERENHALSVLNFSTEISAAEQVISHMEELGYEYRLESKEEQGDTVYYVNFNKPASKAEERGVGFATVPEAIAKVALLTIADIA